jgi:hypothetical protein
MGAQFHQRARPCRFHQPEGEGDMASPGIGRCDMQRFPGQFLAQIQIAQPVCHLLTFPWHAFDDPCGRVKARTSFLKKRSKNFYRRSWTQTTEVFGPAGGGVFSQKGLLAV